MVCYLLTEVLVHSITGKVSVRYNVNIKNSCLSNYAAAGSVGPVPVPTPLPKPTQLLRGQ